MRRIAIILLGLTLVMTVTVPAISQGGVDKDGPRVTGGPSYGNPKSRTAPVEVFDTVIDASEQLLSRMPEDSYLIRPAESRRLMREGAVLVLDVRDRGGVRGRTHPPSCEHPVA